MFHPAISVEKRKNSTTELSPRVKRTLCIWSEFGLNKNYSIRSNVVKHKPILYCFRIHVYHVQCQSIGQDIYDNWVKTDRSFSWVCSKCENLNFSNTESSPLNSLTSVNNFRNLSEESEPPSASPTGQSSPSPTRPTSGKPLLNKDYGLKVLNVNCQSIVNKQNFTPLFTCINWTLW